MTYCKRNTSLLTHDLDFDNLQKFSSTNSAHSFCEFEFLFSFAMKEELDTSDNNSFDTFSFCFQHYSAISSLLESFRFVAFNSVSWKMLCLHFAAVHFSAFSETWSPWFFCSFHFSLKSFLLNVEYINFVEKLSFLPLLVFLLRRDWFKLTREKKCW